MKEKAKYSNGKLHQYINQFGARFNSEREFFHVLSSGSRTLVFKEYIENCLKKIKITHELIDDNSILTAVKQEQEKYLEELTVNFSKLTK